MPRIVTLPLNKSPVADGVVPGGWWHEAPEPGRIVCDLCPRACNLNPGDRGFCFVRRNLEGEMVLTTFGLSTGFCIDPIEKKPLNHFFPGTSVLSFGTAGCNLGCKFCQNWDISKSREVERLSEQATPRAIAAAALHHGCKSVAFTYNDPVVWAEYAIETARACHEVGVKTVAVTAGYITPEARAPFFKFMDAANVDLKGFSESFYEHVTYSHLQPVLDTLEWLKKETDVWFEITILIIPDANDSVDEIRRMSNWILSHCGDDVPVHFTAFHPDFRMKDRGPTPHAKLLEAFAIAREEGLKYVYTGNVDDVTHQSTFCPHCGKRVIERNWYEIGAYSLVGDGCSDCGGKIAGRFGVGKGTWGRRRQPVAIAGFAPPPVVTINLNPPHKDEGRIMNAPDVIAIDAPYLDEPQRAAIRKAAGDLVVAAVLGRAFNADDPTLSGAADLPVEGAYVTLKRQGNLRACCGTLGPTRPLSHLLRQAAYATAKEDIRLPAISPAELRFLDLDVNILYGLKALETCGRDRIEEVEVGRHGLRIQRGASAGLLLPSVATEHDWDSEAFLRHLCRKAGLPSTAWEDDDVVLYTFKSVEFGGPLGFEGRPAEPGGLTPEGLEHIARLARDNVIAFLEGRAPSYYFPGVPDGNVTGLALTLKLTGLANPVKLFQLSLRPGIPFQATLYGLCEAAAKTLQGMGVNSQSLRVGLTVLSDPTMQGTIAEPDIRGVDPDRRGLLAIESDKSILVFSRTESAEGLLEKARGSLEFLDPARATIYSLKVDTTERSLVIVNAPTATVSAGIRPAAQAGRFYPANAEDLRVLVDKILAASERKPEAWAAAMVPHAGLIYSGKVAAGVFNRLEIPELVIVIGPKHTRMGVEWAVSPNEAWAIPGGTVAADPTFARMLADAIPGLKLDSEAHRQEHAIEVQLPFIHRLAPNAKVVGITIGGGNREHCERFAASLAEVIRPMAARPLLLISSDMNHFATDRETRILDEVALKALDSLDPKRLLDTVNEHDISMCGVLPAVIVMETLRRLGGLTTCERLGYATSADVTGDSSRVVGYAGVLLR